MKLGIIGAENSHSGAIAQLLNVHKKVKGFQVTHLWGETADFAKATAEKGQIPNIVKKPTDMLDEVDCVMVDHRHGKYHIPAILPFIKAKKPVFIDKPMCISLKEGKELLKLRKKLKVPVTTMSSIPHQACVAKFKSKIAKIGDLRFAAIDGPGDHKSPYGGVTFYGIHEVDLMVEVFGPRPKSVQSVINGKRCTTFVEYNENFTLTLNLIPGHYTWSVTAGGTEGTFHDKVVTDKNIYLSTTKYFTGMFKTKKEPFNDERMLAPVAILEAMQKSIKTKKKVAIAKF